MFTWLGKRILAGVDYLTAVLTLVLLASRELFRPSRRGWGEVFRAISRQVLFTGVDALPVVSLISLMLGFIVMIQATLALPEVGAGAYLARVVVLTVLHELGPLISAFIVVWRSGTAMTIELGNMQVNQEIAALEAMGIPIERLLVMPRILAAVISMICLTIYFDAVAILGGFLLAQVRLEIPLAVYFDEIFRALSLSDFLITPVKGAAFGLLIAAISCHHGLSVVASTTEIPQQTSRAVLRTVTACLGLDLVLASALYL